ncbi:hypothetical protein CK203_063877 [Vitis vinifera]|uniref:Uncharacterized protein n=1 Tax=Vitis vinifera TaxID=29760 RepID=A0A438G2X6_VITVI|nr:hypothetical protein CK203_063877 [Vitis vinifera]
MGMEVLSALIRRAVEGGFLSSKERAPNSLELDLFWFEAASSLRINLAKSEIFPVGEVEEEKGGLGLRKLALLSKALLGKWIWRFACDKENLWKQVIPVKYGQEGLGWRTNKANGAFGVGVWKEI